MINWKDSTYGRCPFTSRRVSPMTAAQYAANPSLVDSSSDDDASLKLVKFRGKFMSKYWRNTILRKEGSRRHSRKSRDAVKMLKKMGFTGPS